MEKQDNIYDETLRRCLEEGTCIKDMLWGVGIFIGIMGYPTYKVVVGLLNW